MNPFCLHTYQLTFFWPLEFIPHKSPYNFSLRSSSYAAFSLTELLLLWYNLQCNSCTFYSLFVWLSIFWNPIQKQNGIWTCIILYTCTVSCNIRTRAQSVRRQHRKRNSEKRELVTYKHVTEVVRNRCVNHQVKRMVSRAIVLLNATSAGALIIWIIKQTNTNTANQTNKLNK